MNNTIYGISIHVLVGLMAKPCTKFPAVFTNVFWSKEWIIKNWVKEKVNLKKTVEDYPIISKSGYKSKSNIVMVCCFSMLVILFI